MRGHSIATRAKHEATGKLFVHFEDNAGPSGTCFGLFNHIFSTCFPGTEIMEVIFGDENPDRNRRAVTLYGSEENILNLRIDTIAKADAAAMPFALYVSEMFEKFVRQVCI